MTRKEVLATMVFGALAWLVVLAFAAVPFFAGVYVGKEQCEQRAGTASPNPSPDPPEQPREDRR
jgi:hypothetical protein